MERLLTATQLADLLGVHQNYVYDLAASGELPSFKIGGNRRFRASDVESWLQRHREPTTIAPVSELRGRRRR